MKDYRIVRHVDPDKLAKEIRELLRTGWEVQGEVSVHLLLNDPHPKTVYAQAVVLP